MNRQSERYRSDSPYAELIMGGTYGQKIKTIEFRSRPTKIIGERFYIYPGQKRAEGLISPRAEHDTKS